MLKHTCLALLVFTLLSACSSEETIEDVSDDQAVKEAIGKRYEVIGELDAYGIRLHPNEPVEHIVLVPKPGFAGWEVGFERPVPKGATFTIVRVLKTNRLFVNPYSFVVRLEGMEDLEPVPIRIDLIQGNHGEGKIGLNPKIYRPI